MHTANLVRLNVLANNRYTFTPYSRVEDNVDQHLPIWYRQSGYFKMHNIKGKCYNLLGCLSILKRIADPLKGPYLIIVAKPKIKIK